jgi:hypothetical protein
MASQGGFDFGGAENSSGQAGFDFGSAGFTNSDFASQFRRKRERQERERGQRREREQQREGRQERQGEGQQQRQRAGQQERRRGPDPWPSDPWAILGVRMGAWGEIRAAWIALVKQHHPDHGGDAAKFREVQAAYERLRKRAS